MVFPLLLAFHYHNWEHTRSHFSLWTLVFWPCWVHPPARRRPGPAERSCPPSPSWWRCTSLHSPQQTGGRSWCEEGWAPRSAHLFVGSPGSSLRFCMGEFGDVENQRVKYLEETGRDRAGGVCYRTTHSLDNTLLVHDIRLEAQDRKHD